MAWRGGEQHADRNYNLGAGPPGSSLFKEPTDSGASSGSALLQGRITENHTGEGRLSLPGGRQGSEPPFQPRGLTRCLGGEERASSCLGQHPPPPHVNLGS